MGQIPDEQAVANFTILGTHEALERLDNGYVVQEMGTGFIWKKTPDGEGGFYWHMFGDGADYPTGEIELPVAVIPLYRTGM
jgi:hypothetical protein